MSFTTVKYKFSILLLSLSFLFLFSVAPPAPEQEQVNYEPYVATQKFTAVEYEHPDIGHILRVEAEKQREAERWQVRIPMTSDWYITSEYGMRCDVEGVYSGCAMHTGIDFGNGPTFGQPVNPTTEGVVTFVGRSNGAYPACGNYVAVWHELYGISSIYCHLEEVWVTEGEFVTVYDSLGTVGTTGLSNGIHLHLITVYGSAYDGEHFDPRIWFAQFGLL